ncbi:sugar ABC transporter ATP-binding protein [Aquibacillus sp. 3ASR75-11]|uniref:Sugar ABC transporter ATP-binding protein n=1 Tax=Terrihalobacillus insolitus TaxID=2950438 RepID=A0A9X3WYD9_9BACI|nr:multiple monosaccharide ABC transporter ATP-binding protein [Terrihalobacillus insolitus]MDC3425669.1 sugar ABC transporter ATP-binding protein [Terrihalobacillus insolitus]
MSGTILEMSEITKSFPGVKALDNVNLNVEKGEIHALIGENGAGKSTLMKVLSGVHPYGSYSGDIILNGKKCDFKDINQSEALGIVIIHQELALIPELSIAENIFLGNEQASRGIVHWNETITKTKELLKKVGLNISPKVQIKDIGVGQQQLVEIAKALSKDVKLLILDEPTSALNEEDSQNLLNLLLDFKKQGITSILISHKLKELIKVSDRITILRDGKTIETLTLDEDEISEDRIIKGMVGRDLSNLFPVRNPNIGEVLFEVENWSAYHPVNSDRQILFDVKFNVRKGEIIGIAGLMGAGRTELAMSIFGKSYGKKITGKAYKNGVEIDIKNVGRAIENGIAYVSENRKEFGLILIESVKNNITLAGLHQVSNNSILNSNEEVKVAESIKSKINIKAPTIYQKALNLSGGNQQKVVLGKWIYTDPEILILDEPTRGIDVGAKFEIYKIINELADKGKSIIMISSELPELLGMCDRIYTMAEGKITGEVNKQDANQEILMKYMTEDWRA